MKAWQLPHTCDLNTEQQPLKCVDIPIPKCGPTDLLVKISCCGICHTELDEIEGRASPSFFPIIPGHQVIGYVEEIGKRVSLFVKGTRVGIAWIFSSCGHCSFCLSGRENLCPEFKGTGRDANGGYAEYLCVDEKFACNIPSSFSDTEAAPLLCAGAIGYRAIQLSAIKDGEVLGLMGFGASGHLILKMAKYLYPNSAIYVFAGDDEGQKFALSLGATWAGGLRDTPPQLIQAIIDTTPAWMPVIISLSHLQPGGMLIINAIRKEQTDKNELLKLDYSQHLWMEKEIKSVANITTKDIIDFLSLASKQGIKANYQTYSFEHANQALFDLKHHPSKGAKVLLIGTK